MNTTRPLSLRRTLLFTAIGIVLAVALAVSSLTRVGVNAFAHFTCFLQDHSTKKGTMLHD